MTNGAKLTRVLLKLSGEALSGGPTGKSIDPETLKAISEELAEVHGDLRLEQQACCAAVIPRRAGERISRGLHGSDGGE